LGPWGGPDFEIAVVRDGTAGRTRKPGWFENDQPGADREGRSDGFTPAGGAGYRQYRDPGLWSAGEQRIQRTLRVHLLSPAAAIQSRRRLPAAKLRPGNVHSADDWEEVLLPEIQRQHGKEVVVRADAAFAKPEIYEALEGRGVNYAIRIPANENLERDIAELLPRPAGRPGIRPLVGYKSFLYHAASWKKARRVVAKVEHHQGELFPRVGFIVTNLETDSRAVVRFYNKRGTAEQWIKEGKQAVKMTRLSCHRFRSNEVRLWLSLIAYNLGNLWRRLVLPKKIENWSLTSLQQRLVKTGGRLIKHARYYWLLLAEGHLTRRVFAAILRRIWALPLPVG